MSGNYSFRHHEVAQRRRQRDEQKQARELERRMKELAKLSEREQALLAVEAYENQLAVLCSVHKEQGETWDWPAIASSLPSPSPSRLSAHETNARLRISLLIAQQHQMSPTEMETEFAKARSQDEADLQAALRDHQAQATEAAKLRELARRIVAGDLKAYTEALVEFSPLAEISTLGSSLHFSVHSPQLVECEVKVNGLQTIPNETKSLTSSGKLSVKAMPRTRFHELYQDYICGCLLRIAREAFALLPVDCIIVTATTDAFSSSTGRNQEMPVLSAAFTRRGFAALDFDRLDPSDALESFQHHGDFKASRKSEAFMPIVPLTPGNLSFQHAHTAADTSTLLAQVVQMREELRLLLAGLKPEQTDPEPEPLS